MIQKLMFVAKIFCFQQAKSFTNLLDTLHYCAPITDPTLVDFNVDR